MIFERKEKYIVLKIDDVNKYLITQDKTELEAICAIIEDGRLHDRKKQNYYIVVNQDELYAEQVWKLIKNGEKHKSEITFVEKRCNNCLYAGNIYHCIQCVNARGWSLFEELNDIITAIQYIPKEDNFEADYFESD